MAQADNDLPEGTDQSIDGATETGTSPAISTGTAGSGGSAFSGFKTQLRDTSESLRQQATDRAREYAVDGKDKATTALDSIAQIVAEAAASVDDKLGAEYGQYAHRAADGVRSFTDSIRDKEVEDLYDDARELVRKSPAVAVGLAAAIGFALIRVAKAGIDDLAADNDNRTAPKGKRGPGKRTPGA